MAGVLGVLVEKSSIIVALFGDQEIHLIWSFIQSLDTFLAINGKKVEFQQTDSSSNTNSGDVLRKNTALSMKLHEVLVTVLLSRSSFDGDKLRCIVSNAQNILHQSIAMMSSHQSIEVIPANTVEKTGQVYVAMYNLKLCL